MTLCSEDDNKVSELKKCIEEYDLNHFSEILNVLSKEYIDKILIKRNSLIKENIWKAKNIILKTNLKKYLLEYIATVSKVGEDERILGNLI